MKKQETDNANRLLEGAYAIKSARDNIEYYREFAAVYDNDFADAMGYVYPQMLAAVYQRHADTLDSPIVDIGCGTGLVAQSLQTRLQPEVPLVDGIDISKEMLNTADSKGLYRSLYEADLTKQLPPIPAPYGAVLSAGTFTFGHLGPDVLKTLLALGRTNTLYCIGVNSAHYAQQGFDRVLESMCKKQLISKPVFETTKIFDPADADSSETSHSNDTATVVVYRRQ